jgi:hypothetical protein
VHRKFEALWDELPSRVGLEAAQQFYDHVAWTPGEPPAVGTTTVLKGKAGRPKEPGFSRRIHYEISGAGGSTTNTTTGTQGELSGTRIRSCAS